MYTGKIAHNALLVATGATGIFGQSFQGGIRGSVTDSSGAPIDLAKVTLTDEGTGIARTTVSGSGGEYKANFSRIFQLGVRFEF